MNIIVNGKKLPEELQVFLKDQLRFAKIKIKDVDFDSDTWFSDNTMTQKQSDKWLEFLDEQLQQKNSIYQDMFKNKISNKKDRERAIGTLNLMWGLKISD